MSPPEPDAPRVPAAPPLPIQLEVRWLDAQSRHGWVDTAHALAEADEWPHQLQVSCGYLIRDDEHGVLLAQTIGHHDNCADTIWIPRAMIHSTRVPSIHNATAPPIPEPGDV